jgi:hypothetical protein
MLLREHVAPAPEPMKTHRAYTGGKQPPLLRPDHSRPPRRFGVRRKRVSLARWLWLACIVLAVALVASQLIR